ncbi:MAG: FAD-dependent thymidylate synthase [Ruminococcaceae bacterium]|nr:FAD-dependent thymidylate synthase [Oscillospiraceae bacterium]
MSQKVILLAYTPEPEKTVASAAKLCYSSSGIVELKNGLDDEATAKFVKMLSSLGHDSPTEHASFTFGIEGVSRSLLAQITRHRIASFSVKSQRYVTEGCFEYVIPPEIEKIPEAKEEYIKAMEADQAHYDSLTKVLYEKHYKDFIAKGLSEKEASSKAEKMAIEDARYVLPNACETKMILTMNTRSLKNFFAHRCCNRAQWEIRELAEKMLMLVREVSPSLFATSGPACVSGKCPEGKMTCGQMEFMRNKYLGK